MFSRRSWPRRGQVAANERPSRGGRGFARGAPELVFCSLLCDREITGAQAAQLVKAHLLESKTRPSVLLERLDAQKRAPELFWQTRARRALAATWPGRGHDLLENTLEI